MTQDGSGRNRECSNPEGYATAVQYVTALTGAADADVTIQTFSDGGMGDAVPTIVHGTLDLLWPDIEAAQEDGQGVFVMVNSGDFLGRSAKNVHALRALFLDDDKNTVTQKMLSALPPDIIVHSGSGFHYYWLLDGTDPLDAFTPAQKALAGKFGTDPKVSDLPRVLRLPGTQNFKNRADPQDVVLLKAKRPATLHTIREVLSAFNAEAVGAASGTPLPAAPPGGRVLSSLPLAEKRKNAKAYVAKIRAVQGQGGDQTTFKVGCILLRDFDLPYDEAWKVMVEWNLTNASPPWNERDLTMKLESARKSATGKAGKMYEAQERVAEVKAQGSVLDPSWYCYDMTRANGPWRFWKNGVWQDGVAGSALDRMLENAGLDKASRDCWKRAVVVVNDCRAVYSSRDKLVLDGGEMIANTYRAPTLVAEEGDCSPALEVIQNLAGDDPEAERWLLGWLAKVVQAVHAGRPARIGTCPVVFGPKGSGKGVLEAMCRALLGRDNVVSIGQAELNSQFNGWLSSALLVFADEVFSSDQKASALSAKIKNYITAHVLSLDVKGQPQRQVASVANWIMASNSHRPVEVESGDRRFTLLRTGPAIPVELGALVADDARDEGPICRALLHYLLAMPADKLAADYKPLHTAAKEEARRASGNAATRFAAEVVERGFFSVTSSWVQQGGQERDLYLRADAGLRCLKGVDGPLILRRTLMAVARSYAQEVGAQAVAEGTLMAALRESIPSVCDATIEVGERLERVVGGLPGAIKGSPSYAPPEEVNQQLPLIA
jgi:hypothetical protein